jgi:hypothetical protein
MRSFYLLGALAFLAAPASALEFKPLVQADVLAGHETQPMTAVDNFAWTGQLYLLPAVQLTPTSSFLPLLAYLRQDSDVVVEEDSFFTEQDSFLARPLYRLALNGRWDLKVWGDARRTVTIENPKQAWSTGLYDYEEFGGGAGAVWKASGDRLNSLDLGLEVLHRGYMNWHELSSDLVAQDGMIQNYYDKDYVGYKADLKLVGARQGRWDWNADLSYLYRAFTDALVDSGNGLIPGDSRREDHYGYLDAKLTRTQGDWTLDVSLDVAGNLSNMNYVDAATAVYLPGMDDYLSEQLGLALTFAPHGDQGPSATAQASLLNRDYQGPGGIGRSIRNLDGTFAKGKENDLEQRYHLDGRWPLMWGVALVADVDFTNTTSNQSLFNGYQPAYELFQAMAGLQYKL